MRVFVAVDVGDEMRAEVARVTAVIGEALAAAASPPRVTWVPPRALHMTLRFIGEVDEPEKARLAGLLATPISLAPFDVEWRGLGAFPSPRHPRALWMGIVAGAAELGRLEAQISRRIASSLAGDAAPLRPHVTLGRVRTPGAGVDWIKLLQAIDVRGVRSRVDRVTLYRSELSARGPHYTGLAHAPLVGA
jgi:2'-5' RNA ligase